MPAPYRPTKNNNKRRSHARPKATAYSWRGCSITLCPENPSNRKWLATAGGPAAPLSSLGHHATVGAAQRAIDAFRAQA